MLVSRLRYIFFSSLAQAGKAVASFLCCEGVHQLGMWLPRSLIGRCLLFSMASASWVDEFIARYEAQGLGMIEDLDDDWTRRTREYGVRRPTQVGRVFVYRAFDLWTQTGPFYRATVATHQMMIPDELLWRIALHWPDLGNDWNQVEWKLVPVDDSRSGSCLTDLIHPTYVLIMPKLLSDMSHRPHGLLEVTQGDTCHVRATVLPPRINLPILQELLHAFCRRGWPMVRCLGTHNRAPLTDELQDCSHGSLCKSRSLASFLHMLWTSLAGASMLAGSYMLAFSRTLVTFICLR